MMLDKKQKYLQVALNGNLEEALRILIQLPADQRIIIEAGTPLIKRYGILGIKKIKNFWARKVLGACSSFNNSAKVFSPYIVADLKCMDRGLNEIEIALRGGASAVTALGSAPLETLDEFVEKCSRYNIDSMIDMMNVEYPLSVLRNLKNLPEIIVLHRGVDEEKFNKEKEIPFAQIQMIKSTYDILVSVAGGDSFAEVQRGIFNDADIVVVWKDFYQLSENTAKLAEEFLKEIR